MMKVDTPVSVIVPVFNCKQYLGRCVESLAGQTYPTVEILLVDDGSTDGSGQLCDLYAKKFPRVRAFHIPHSGVSSARNVGLEKATGSLIAFCDGDDTFVSDTVKLLAERMEETGTDLCIGKRLRVCKGNWSEGNDPFFKLDHITFSDVLETVGTDAPYNGGGYVTNKMFRRSLLQMDPPLRFDTTLSCYEDLQFVLQFLQRSVKVSKVDEIVYVYHVDNTNSISQLRTNWNDVRKLEGLGKICATTLSSFPHSGKVVASRKNQMMRACCSLYARLFAKRGEDARKCRKYLLGLVRKESMGLEMDGRWDMPHRILFFFTKWMSRFDKV